MSAVQARRGDAEVVGDGRLHVTLPASPASARLARDLLRRVTGSDEDARAALIVSELITNAVRHADAAPELDLEWDGSMLHIEVFDTGAGRPVCQEVDVRSTSGRGVAIVDAVADRWGVTERTGGKVVWAEIDLRRPPA